MTVGQTTRALCIGDGATVPAEIAVQAWDHRMDITTHGKDPEVNFVVEHLLGKLSGRLDPRVQDVLALAAYCFAADRMVRRGGPIDVHREGWRREFVLCIPVSDPGFWSQPELVRLLTETLNFGTDDRWSFHFDAVDRTIPQLEITWDDRDLLEQPDTVMLFSGGTDSLCGLVDAVRRQGAKPVLVSHWTADHVKSRQQRLRTAVRGTLGDWEFPHVQIELHRRGKQDGESSQRTRGFLFACLGAAIAAHLQVRTVLLPENGYVSINPRFNDQLRGALASRGTHPKFLYLFNCLINRVFDGGVQVVNPLWNATRAEALETLRHAGCPELLRQTYSCGKLQGRSPGKSHCGGCSQCVDRRFAVIQAGLDDYDPLDRYEFDVFTKDIPEGEPRTVALSYLRFADAIRPLAPEAILDQRRELDVCVDPDDSDADRQFLELAAVLQRHSVEALEVMSRMYRRWGEELAKRTIDDKSLLVLWQHRSTAEPGNGDDRAQESAGGATFGVERRSDQSRFQRQGKVWLIEFRQEKGGLPDQVGTQRLARILKAGGEALEALDLTRGSNPGSRRSKQGPPEVFRSSNQADAGDVLDEKAITAFRNRVDELNREIQVAFAAGESHKAGDRERERAWIERELTRWIGKHDKPRHFPEEHERARQTVSATVWPQVRELREYMPLLTAHLETFLHLGYVCSYSPDPPERWDVEL
jgi:7-cyano-7-deazaguanine synthase in queuosine biosynthesis